MTSASPAPEGQRVLAIHRYYWPDTPPYASILRAIAERWSASGHTVDILTSQPSYKPELALARRPRVEQLDGSSIRRVNVRPDRSGRLTRAFNVGYFPLRAMLHVLLGRRYDVVMCSTVPPVVLGSLVSWAARRRRARFVYHCMDIHPEIGAISGEFRNKVVFDLLRRLDMGTCRRASRIVVLSSDMRAALEARDPSLRSKIEVLNNFDLPTYGDVEADPVGPPAEGKVRLVFTGNLGRFQGLETLVGAVLTERTELDALELVFMGEGSAKPALQRQVEASPTEVRGRVTFLAHGSPAHARALVRSAHYGVVSLTPGVINYAYPSKCATYLAEGVPVLALVEPDSELARDVVSREFGVASDPAQKDAVIEAVARLARERDLQQQRASSARAVWRTDLSQEALLPRWEKLLAELSSVSEVAA